MKHPAIYIASVLIPLALLLHTLARKRAEAWQQEQRAQQILEQVRKHN